MLAVTNSVAKGACEIVMYDIQNMNIYHDINDGDMIWYRISLYRELMNITKMVAETQNQV